MTDSPAIPHIVVGVDGSTSSIHALDWAVGQAEMTEAPLDVVVTWQWPTTYGWGMPVPATYNPARDAEGVLDGVLKPVRHAHPTLALRTSVVESHPSPALVKASRGASLLVVGSRGHGEFAGMLLGSVSEYCVTRAHCPVLVIRGTAAASVTKRIVVGVDGAESSLHALRWAVGQAELSTAAVEVVSTWEWPTSYGRGMPLTAGYEPAIDAEAALDDAVAAVRPLHRGLDIHTSVVEGHPAGVLVDASRSADLLVVGSRGHGEFVGMLLGSVSEHCASNAHCPVLVFREER